MVKPPPPAAMSGRGHHQEGSRMSVEGLVAKSVYFVPYEMPASLSLALGRETTLDREREADPGPLSPISAVPP